MKELMITLSLSFAAFFCWSQAPEGRIVYENTSQLRIQFLNSSSVNTELEKQIPKVQIRSFELIFGNNQSVWQQLPDARQDAEQLTQSSGNRMIFKSMIGGSKDEMTYCNFSNNRMVMSRELNDQKYLVVDTISTNTWQLEEEYKDLLGFKAQKAKGVITTKRAVMQMENGEMIRKELPETIQVTAWFTEQLPIPAGPVYQGQLPGVILELDINNGQSVYKAVEFSPKVNLAKIKEPKGGKKTTQHMYDMETRKSMEESLKRISENRRQIFNQQ